MNDILTTILKDTFTLHQLKNKLNVLKTYLSQTFFGGVGSGGFDAEDLVWLKSLPPTLLQSFNKDNLTQVFTDFDKQINSLKVLTMYLTFEPDKDSLAAIGTKVRTAFPGVSLIDLKIDPTLIAGPAFVWHGIYKDFSLKASIEAKKALILENLKKFLR